MRYRAALVVTAVLIALSLVAAASAQQGGMGSQMPQSPQREAAEPMEGEPTATDESEKPMPRGQFGRGNFGDDDIR